MQQVTCSAFSLRSKSVQKKTVMEDANKNLSAQIYSNWRLTSCSQPNIFSISTFNIYRKISGI